MIICIPVEGGEGLQSVVAGSFGTAPRFLLYDLGAGTIEYLDNTSRDHPRGMCQPLRDVLDHAGDAVVCRGMSLHGIQMLESHGIKVCRTDAETAAEAIEAFKRGLVD